MVLWQSDLRISTALTVVLAAAARHCGGYCAADATAAELHAAMAIAAVAGGVRQRAQPAADPRLSGEIKLMTDSRLRWQKAEWEIVGTPWVINSGMLLRLQDMQTRRRQHLWIAADSMDAKEWRDLRRLVLQKPAQE